MTYEELVQPTPEICTLSSRIETYIQYYESQKMLKNLNTLKNHSCSEMNTNESEIATVK